MDKNKALNKRICLEKKWSNNCVKHNCYLPSKAGRVLSVSPSAYYHYTGVNACGEDIREYRKLSQSLHCGEREEIEKEVLAIISKEYYLYFFEIKDILKNLSYDDFCQEIEKYIKKDKYNRVQRLFRKWEQLSHKCHYKVTGALRRLNDKIID